jgi:hypothetical protein
MMRVEGKEHEVFSSKVVADAIAVAQGFVTLRKPPRIQIQRLLWRTILML